MTAGTPFAQAFGGQRAMLDELARIGHAPSIQELADNLGCHPATARRCALWLEREGFVSVDRGGRTSVRVRLVRNPGDEELNAAIAGRRADL